MVDKETNL